MLVLLDGEVESQRLAENDRDSIIESRLVTILIDSSLTLCSNQRLTPSLQYFPLKI